MRLKSIILSSTSAAVFAFAANPALAQTSVPAQTDTSVQAQETPADPEAGSPQVDDPVQGEGAEIVVTGFRESLRSAQNLKRNSEQIVDAIVAEDIGKLPDLAVSDTAARIPGLQVIRRGGEADTVLVRGLPDFTTTYNGREIFTAERREVALQDFPSANIAALEVFKTTTANLVEAGLAGQVNVRSRRPFDFRGTEIAGSVWALHTVQADAVTPNFNALFSTRWNTGIGEMGLLVNVSRTELQFLDSEPSNTDFIADPVINGQRVRFPDVQRLFYRSGNRSRPSVNAAFQWRPSDTLQFYADVLYQGFRNKIDDRLVAVPLYNGANYSNLVFRPGTNLLESGTVTGLGDPIFTFQGGTLNQTDTYQFAVGGIYEAGPLRITADLARTDSTFEGSTASVDRIFAGQATTSVDFDLRTPQFAIRNFNRFDPNSYLFDGFYEEAQLSEGDDYQARLDLEYSFDEPFILSSIQAGVRYTDRDAFRSFGSRFAPYRGRGVSAATLPLFFYPSEPGFRGTDVQSDFNSFLTPTYDSIRDNILNLRRFVGFPEADPLPNARSTYEANEKTLAGYAQANLRFGQDIEAVIGIRGVQTETVVAGTSDVAGVLTPVSFGRKYTDWLPNASLRWRITPRVQFRLSATQTRTRPTFQQLNPSSVVGPPDPLAGGRRTGGGGNPLLEPFTSNNYDATLEYYFSPTGFASVALFRRDLEGFIVTDTVDYTDPVLGPLRITGPVNTSEGQINGVEAQLSTFFDFDFVPNFFRSFGVQANYTYLDAQIEGLPIVLANDPPPDQGGVSEHTVNLAAIYENAGFAARLTYNWRSNFFDRRDQRGESDLYIEEANPPGRFDLSANYTFNENVTVFFDWTNITGDPLQVNFNSARDGAPRAEYVRFLRYEETTFSLGLRFRL